MFAKETFDILNYWRNKKPKLFHENKEKVLLKEADIFSEMGNFYALESKRKEALLKIAHFCMIHETLKKQPEVNIDLQ